MTDKQIGQALGVSAGTVHTHWARILAKLKANSRAEAAALVTAGRVTSGDSAAIQGGFGHDTDAMLELVLEASETAVWATDEKGRVTRYAGFMGWLPPSVRSSLLSVATPALSCELLSPEELSSVLSGHAVVGRVERGDVVVQTRAHPIWGSTGRCEGIAAVTTVAPPTHEEPGVEEEQGELRRIVDAMPAPTLVLDMSTMRITEAFGQGYSVFGYAPKDLVAMGSDAVGQLVHPEDQARVRAGMIDAAASQPGTITRDELRVRTLGGKWQCIEIRITPFTMGVDGRAKELMVSCHNVTERVLALRDTEHRVQRIRERFELLAKAWDGLPFGLVLFDAKKAIQRANGYAAHVLDLTATGLGSSEGLNGALAASMLDGTPGTPRSLELRSGPGGSGTYQVAWSPIHNSVGGLIGYVATISATKGAATADAAVAQKNTR